ncbi:MAG: glutaredoxin family protein, partial [Anaerolineales bacterium]
MLHILLYTRQGCHLCEQTKRDLIDLQERYPHEVTEINIEENEEINKRYALEIPVLQIGPYTLKAPIRKDELIVVLAAASDRNRQIESLDLNSRKVTGQQKVWSSADQIVYWIAKHYLGVINAIVLIYVFLPF